MTITNLFHSFEFKVSKGNREEVFQFLPCGYRKNVRCFELKSLTTGNRVQTFTGVKAVANFRKKYEAIQQKAQVVELVPFAQFAY